MSRVLPTAILTEMRSLIHAAMRVVGHHSCQRMDLHSQSVPGKMTVRVNPLGTLAFMAGTLQVNSGCNELRISMVKLLGTTVVTRPLLALTVRLLRLARGVTRAQVVVVVMFEFIGYPRLLTRFLLMLLRR